jgi:pilus assembly protein Flp/PilA
MEKIKQFFNDETGASAVEYALLVAGIAVVVMVGINSLGGAVKAKFDEVTGLL